MISLNLEYIKEKVLEVYKECDIHSFPIDCLSILKHYGIRTITYKETKEQNPELYKAISNYSKDAFRFRMSVYYNSSNTDGRIRFSLMHELGHFILGHTEECYENEDEADYFASNILAPRVAIETTKCVTSDDIHDVFGMSYAASNRTLTDYKKWVHADHSSIDEELKTWIYYPNFYRHCKLYRKNRERERRKIEYQKQFYEERLKWISENIYNYDEYVWIQHDEAFY